MNKRVKGTILGFLASLGGVVAWVLLGFLGFIAGIAGALMGFLFIVAYRAANPKDEGVYRYIAAAIVMVVEIVVSEFLVYVLLDLPLSFILANPDHLVSLIMDIVVGVLLSAVVLVIYIVRDVKEQKNRRYMEEMQKNAAPAWTPASPAPVNAPMNAAMPDINAQNAQPMPETSAQNAADETGRKRTITVVRKWAYNAMFVPVSLLVDGREVAQLKSKERFVFEVPAVPHNLQVGWKQNKNVSPPIMTDYADTPLYFVIETIVGFTAVTFQLTPVPSDPDEKQDKKREPAKKGQE